MALRKLDHNAYTVGWVSALDCELIAARALLDEEDEALEPALHDANFYVLGRFEKHNVVITSTSGYGTNAATQAVTNMIRSFPNIRFGLMVGIGGAVPGEPNPSQPMKDIRLGDIVVSEPKGNHGGVLNYDMGKWRNDSEFSIESHLNSPPSILRQAVTQLRLDHRFRKGKMKQYTEQAIDLIRHLPDVDDASFPGWEEDRLFKADYDHVNPRHKDCRDCNSTQIVERSPRPSTIPAVHYGLIASGNAVMRSATLRDRLRDAWNVKCFEMEAAGLMNHFPCLIIRGLCDYSDSHKAKRWQAYAAVVAAAYAKDLLRIIGLERIKSTEAATDNMKEVINAISHVDDGVQKLRNAIDDTYRRKILDWLSPIDHESEQSDFFATRQESTGQWFLDSDEFQRWVNEPKQTLLCQGIPGAGKTVMTSIVVHDLHQRFSQVKGIGITYVYGNFLRRTEQQLSAILSSLLKQLCQSFLQLPPCVTEAYERFWTLRVHPSPEKLLHMLGTVMTSSQKTYVVVDALDEIETSDGTCRQLLAALFRLQQVAPMSLIASSRHVADITSTFRANGSHIMEIRALDDDIRSYIDSQLNKARPFVSGDQQLRSRIKETIVQAVDGMFLLAKLHLDSLGDKICKADIKTALTSLPTGGDAYDRVYDESMDRINSQTENLKNLARRALMWTVCTKSLLTVEGLQRALAITSAKKALDADNMPDIDLVIEVCSGLIKFDEKSKVIRLVHFTAQEYFQRKWKTWFADAHSEIAWACVFYLTWGKPKPEYGTEAPDSQWPSLYDYASSNWQYHALLDPTDDIFTRRLLEDPSIVAHWDQTTSPRCFCDDGPSTGCFIAPTNASPLHFAVYHGTETSVRLLLERGADCNKEDKYQRTPLAWAAEQSAVAAARSLLDTGANINHVDYLGCTPLSYAAAWGSPEMIQLLIDRGAIADRPDNAGQTAFAKTCYREDRDATIPIFVAHDPALVAELTDVEILDDIVQWARAHKGEEFVRMIEEKGPPEAKSASLLVASREGDIDDVKRLIREGANPDYREPVWGRSALSQAAEYDETAVVSHLLKNGVDPDMLDINGCADSQNNEGNTPLMWAIRNGHFGPFCALLEHGADPSKAADDKDRGGGLHFAAELDRIEMIEILLKKGTQINDCDNHYRQQTPLSSAAERGHLQSVRLLLDRGADPKSADVNGRQPLSWAAQNGHTQVVDCLLEKTRDDIDLEDDTGKTPLCYAAMNGRGDVVGMLLSKGAQHSVKDRDGHDPLHYALQSGNKAAIEAFSANRIPVTI
ncbi:uncharacterized protein N7458_009535 [Penicillium daleae]|uniref:Nucleoside phosphorylase domain-containing protein n=1 Tax=Penicillium daleae TaxID=63821 RepID=A0AAD6FZF6_9EURO|nr:uncharacterized protein N7458_009535 [Penicillium daleae]KAJ5438537.1 hypothetical protein N7458_009535 [Penicillium daleae]